MTRALVAARSPGTRAGLESLLARNGLISVVGSSSLADDLADVIAAAVPDVVLLVLDPGAELPLPLLASPDRPREPAIIVLGDEPVEAWAPRAIRAGAHGALPRSATAEEVLAAVEAVLAGLVVMPADLAETVVRIRGGAAPAASAQPLTPREAEVLGLLAEGLGNKVIAARLGISDHTVKTHLAAVFAKLRVSNRAEAVSAGVRQGLIML